MPRSPLTAAAIQRRKLQPASERRARRGKCMYRCGVCLEMGHTRKRCPIAVPVRDARHIASNDGYRSNREAGLCDRCGCKSATAYCADCSAARKLAPSRNGQNAKVRAQRKRWRLAAKQRRSRR